MPDTRGQMEKRQSEEIITTFCNSDVFKCIISEIMQNEMKHLHDEITQLKTEVKNLTDSNKDLIKLLTNYQPTASESK